MECVCIFFFNLRSSSSPKGKGSQETEKLCDIFKRLSQPKFDCAHIFRQLGSAGFFPVAE